MYYYLDSFITLSGGLERCTFHKSHKLEPDVTLSVHSSETATSSVLEIGIGIPAVVKVLARHLLNKQGFKFLYIPQRDQV